MRAALAYVAGALGVASAPWAAVGVEFLALMLGGYVAGHFAPDWEVLNGALAATAYILVLATVVAAREAVLVAQAGFGSLPPIDFLALAVSDLIALTGASLGGWLAHLTRPPNQDTGPVRE